MTSSRTKKQARGFTLIELLVVVSIISLLSSVILASIKESRGKAQDSKVVSQLLEMRKVAELSNSNGGYGTATSNNDCGSLITAFTSAGFTQAGSWPNGLTPVCYSDAASNDLITAFSVWNNLNNSSGWCVDSEGTSVRLDNAPDNHVCTPGSGNNGGGGLALEGESCSGSNSDCATGYCGYDGSTYERICTSGSNLSLCSNDDQCSSGFCSFPSSTCSDRNSRPVDAYCEENSQCSSNSCSQETFVCNPA